MNLKRIKLKAKRLHKALIIGTVSLSLLGILSGCHANVTRLDTSSVNLTSALVNHRMQPVALNKMLAHQYKWPLSDSDTNSDSSISDSIYYDSDTILHDGHVEQIKATKHSKYFNDYGKNWDEIQPSDGKSKADKQTINYHINNKKDTITFNSIHADNSLHTITYKLLNMRKSSLSPKKTVYEFKPIRLRRYGHKHSEKVPSGIAEHNIIKLKPGLRVHRAHRYSLNNVQK